jgi:enediyne biosynthesis protein E4
MAFRFFYQSRKMTLFVWTVFHLIYSMKYIALVSLVLFASCNRSETKNKNAADAHTLFTLVSAKQSNIDFINRVEDDSVFNILTYRNFYNGGGVAIGDINNDGLPDIYFTSNKEKNKLYLNKGNFVFEDISEKAGIGGKRAWSTGVSMADVNNDGFLDIYVCNSGDIKGDDRENELFINNGDLTFSERAKDYNLNNNGFSTHASFFDYDLDGDLDCYILNNSFIDPGKIKLYGNARTEVDDLGGDKLYRNDGTTFTDVTLQANIYSSKIGFGLGVSVSDLNNDFLPDIYISNDFWERDYLYINQGNGTFKEQLNDRINICSVSSMGADIADINNDGNPEIFTTDMLPGDNYRIKAMTQFDAYHLEQRKYSGSYHYQILQNCLHLNNGNAHFQEIASFAGVSATDWSWGALIFDFDNNGWSDIFVSNGITRDIMYLDFTDFISDRDNVRHIVTEKGKFDWRDFVGYIPSNPLKSYGFINNKDLTFTNQSDQLGLGNPSFSNGAAYGDLDNDGDLDLVVNNVNRPCFVYKNESEITSKNNYLKLVFKGPEQNRFGIGAVATIYAGDKKQVLQNFPSRGFQSCIEPILNFGVGEVKIIDKVEVVWPDKKRTTLTNVSVNQRIEVDQNGAVAYNGTKTVNNASDFREISSGLFDRTPVHTENSYNDFDHELLTFRMFSTEGPRLLDADVNNDGRQDVLLLGAANDPDKLFIQTANGSFSKVNSSVFDADAAYESTAAVFVDLNRDGDLDLVVGSGGNEYQRDKKYFQLRIYLNDGAGNFKREIDQRVPPDVANVSCIAASDFDGDGYVDLFVGSRLVPGNYGLVPRSFLYKNIQGRLVNFTPINLGGVGMVTDALWTDFDSDKDQDLLITTDWTEVNMIINDQGQFRTRLQLPGSSGWWTRAAAADLDGDGDDDYVLGNWGLNGKFKASSDKPLTMFVKDFDGNGRIEQIINWNPPLDNRSYPFATKQEITQQLPVLKKSILKYETYAHKGYSELFPDNIRKGAIPYKAEMLESVILWNDRGKLSIEKLPPQAQWSPVFAICLEDLDQDGIRDIWLGGNFYALKPQAGRHDSNKGVFLKGLGGRKFTYVTPVNSGIFVNGEVRDAKVLPVGGRHVLIVARNNDSVIAFERKANILAKQ